MCSTAAVFVPLLGRSILDFPIDHQALLVTHAKAVNTGDVGFLYCRWPGGGGVDSSWIGGSTRRWIVFRGASSASCSLEVVRFSRSST